MWYYTVGRNSAENLRFTLQSGVFGRVMLWFPADEVTVLQRAVMCPWISCLLDGFHLPTTIKFSLGSGAKGLEWN